MMDNESPSGVPLLPPSPNWFSSGALDCRLSDRLLVTASFKSVVLYRLPVGARLPVVLKCFNTGSKVLQVRLFPHADHPDHQGSVLVTGEYGTVTLYSADTGQPLLQHKQHKGTTIGGVCWSLVPSSTGGGSSGGVRVVSVAAAGAMEVWDVEANITHRHTITTSPHHHHHHHPAPLPNLTLVEAVPGGKGQVLVVADKVVLLVDTKTGFVLSQLRGHDHPIYCLRLYPGEGSPLTPSHSNPRARGLLSDAPTNPPRGSVESSGAGDSSSSNWRNKPAASSPAREDDPPAPSTITDTTSTTRSNSGGSDQAASSSSACEGGSDSSSSSVYFASSDTGRCILVWDLTEQRYIAKTTVGGQQGGNRRPNNKYSNNRSSSSQVQHVALAWHGSQLISNTASGELVSISLWASNGSNGFANHKPASSSSSSNGAPSAGSGWTASATTEGDEATKGSRAPAGSGGLGQSSTRSIHREHNRVVYNIHLMGSLVVSSSQDRSLIGYCLESQKMCFNLPTLGAVVNTMSFNPHDESWLTLGLQENSIKLVNLHSTPAYRCKTVYNGIKGKVLALSWHCKDEGKVLFGTGDGQVGIADFNSMKVSCFSHFHQRSVYKVQWAPVVLADRFPQLAQQSLCAYSFGDREIVLRDPSNLLADPIKLTKICSHLPKDISEFSFSPDFKFLAVGCQDGCVSVLRCSDLTELVKLILVRKAIQHILWLPSKTGNRADASEGRKLTDVDYTIAIASNDTKICIMDLTTVIRQQMSKLDDSTTKDNQSSVGDTASDNAPSCGDPASPYEAAIVTSCNRELVGHASRVIWLSCSPHNPNLLASASYDHTCQVWNTATGEHLGNYRGHVTRIFRVEFSPSEAGLLYSFGEENSVHQWRLTDLKDKSPPAKVNKATEVKPIQVLPSNDDGVQEGTPVGGEGGGVRSAAKPQSSGRRSAPDDRASSSPTPAPNNKASSSSVSSAAAETGSRRTPSHKSLFPCLHKACCHKRGFSLVGVLCMSEHRSVEDERRRQQDELSLDELLDEEGVLAASAPPPSLPVDFYPAVLERVGGALLEGEELDNPPPTEDLQTLLDFYGPPQQLSKFIKKQIAEHEASNHLSSAAPLHLWQSSLEQLVRAAIAGNCLTADLVAQCPQISLQLWQLASEAYAAQLVTSEQYLLASSYLLNAKKTEEAVELLMRHKLQREGLALLKSRLAYSTDLHDKYAQSFAATAIYEGNYDLAALLYSSAGNFSAAASALSRRGDPSSLLVAGLLYARDGSPLAQPTLLDALKSASVKGQLDKIPVIVSLLPELKWFSLVAAVQATLQQLEASPTREKMLTRHFVTSKNGDMVLPVTYIRQRWAEVGHSPDQHQQVYQQLETHLSTSTQPTALKQFYFLVSVEITKLLLSLSLSSADSTASNSTELPAASAHLSAVVQLLNQWGRPEQLLDVTHVLLQPGPCCPLYPLLKASLPAPALLLLLKMYCASEVTARIPSADEEASSTSHPAAADVPAADAPAAAAPATDADAPATAADADVPSAATAADVPSAATAADVPSVTAADVPSAAAADVPSAAAAADVPSAAVADVPSAAAADVPSAPLCELCNRASLTVQHFLFDCPELDVQRRQASTVTL